MRTRRRRSGLLAAATAGSLILTIAVGGPVAAVEYPTWDEVEAARQDQAAAARQVAGIQGMLVELEARVGTLARETQLKAELSAIAATDFEAALARSTRLAARSTTASETAAASAQRAGALVAQAARTGSGDLSVALLFSPDAGDLLAALGTMGRLTDQASRVYAQAITDRNAAAAAAAQASRAEAERVRLAQQAQQALDAAKAASAAAQRELGDAQVAAEQLYAQLATLKGTTADLERQYIAGLVGGGPSGPGASNPGPSNPAPGTPGGPGPVAPPVTPPVSPPIAPPVTPPVTPPVSPPSTPSAIQVAIDFAKAQLGKPWVWAGNGSNGGWDCSGLTKWSYGAAGVYIGIHGATSQYNYLRDQGLLVSVNDLRAGDLVFYADGGDPAGTKYHTALYLGGGQMIESPYDPLSVRIAPLRWFDLVPYAARPVR